MLFKLLKKEEERQLLAQIKKTDGHINGQVSDINLSLVMAEGKKVAIQKEKIEKLATLRLSKKATEHRKDQQSPIKEEEEGKSPPITFTKDGGSVDSISAII